MTSPVLDTSVASMMYDGVPAFAPYAAHLQQGTPIISFQTVAEMRFGALKKNWGQTRRAKLELFLTSFQIIDYSNALGHHWAEVMRDAQQAGRRLEAADGWIAATAALLNAPLLTHDRDFDPQACPSITIIRYTL